MIVFPNAKINLGLNVLSKRQDGFHNIKSCFLPIGLSDILEFIVAKKKTRFTSTGISIPGNPDSNLCIEAWRFLSKDFNIPPIDIHLHKIIPIGAGLGGGSSDGAFMLKVLNDFFELNLSIVELKSYAGKLGSDCPFFLDNVPSIVQGKGDILNRIPLDLSGYKIAVVNPGVHISTPEAYLGIVPGAPDENLEEILKQPIENWSGMLKNDFERSVFLKYPEIKRVKDELYNLGAVFSLMSGSGSSVFGIFKEEVPTSIRSKFNPYYVWVQEV